MALGVLGAAPAHADVANTAPVAVADFVAVTSGQSVSVSPLVNDSDPDPGAVLTLAAVAVTDPAAGSAVQSGSDVLITSAPGFVGALLVAYTVSDGELTADGTITVDVQAPPNVLPVAVPDVAQMYSGGQLLLDPRANDSDPDSEALSVTSAAVSAGAGTVATDGQVLTIGAAAGYAGPLVVTYVVADPRGGQATSTVTVDVIKAPNRAPVAVADAVSVTVGRTYRIPVLANDSDPDGDRITLAKVGKAAHGQATRSGTKVVYRAPKSWTGRVKVAYTVRDASGATTKGVLMITVGRRARARAEAEAEAHPDAAGRRGAPSKAAVESALARLGLPTGSANGKYDARTYRAVCAWRTVTGRAASRRAPSAPEARAIVATAGLPAAAGSMVTGLNVSLTCQAVFWGRVQPRVPASHGRIDREGGLSHAAGHPPDLRDPSGVALLDDLSRGAHVQAHAVLRGSGAPRVGHGRAGQDLSGVPRMRAHAAPGHRCHAGRRGRERHSRPGVRGLVAGRVG